MKRFLPVFPPSTESATPAPLGKAISTPNHSRLTSPRDFISAVGKLVELPHFVSENVVNNLWKICLNLFVFKISYPIINPQVIQIIKPMSSFRRPCLHSE